MRSIGFSRVAFFLALFAVIGFISQPAEAARRGGYSSGSRSYSKPASKPSPKQTTSKKSSNAGASPKLAKQTAPKAAPQKPAASKAGASSKAPAPTKTDKSQKKVDKVLSGSEKRPGNTRGPSTIYDKSGGHAAASKDFDSMKLKKVKPIPGGRVGELPDGRNVVQRDANKKEGLPTVEVQEKDRKRTKVRYGQ